MSRAELKIIKEGVDWAVVYKPPFTHSDDCTALRAALALRAVHRLDYETSGLLLLASETSWKAYNSLFLGESEVHKLYLAGVDTRLTTPHSGRTEGFVGSRYRSSKKVRFDTDRSNFRGYHSVLPASHNVRETKIAWPGFTGKTYEVELHTGRRHQIRAFFEFVGAPILSDPLYGVKIEGHNMELVSYSLELTSPTSKEKISVTLDSKT